MGRGREETVRAENVHGKPSVMSMRDVTKPGRYNPSRAARYVARRAFGTIFRFQTQEKVLALTFDDGPDPEETPEVLDILDRNHASATFFMIGEAARSHGHLVQQVAAQGHTVGNHTFSHASMPRIGWADRWRELSACQRALQPYGRRYFRMPFGHQSIGSHIQTLAAGYQVFGWTHKADDTRGRDAAYSIGRLDGKLQPGDIVAFHDTVYHYEDERQVCRKQMQAALQDVVSKYSDLGFRWINLEAMMRVGKPERTHWYRSDDDLDFSRLKRKPTRERRVEGK